MRSPVQTGDTRHGPRWVTERGDAIGWWEQWRVLPRCSSACGGNGGRVGQTCDWSLGRPRQNARRGSQARRPPPSRPRRLHRLIPNSHTCATLSVPRATPQFLDDGLGHWHRLLY